MRKIFLVVFSVLLVQCSGPTEFSQKRKIDSALGKMEQTLGKFESEELDMEASLIQDSLFTSSYQYVLEHEEADSLQIYRANELLGRYTAIRIKQGARQIEEGITEFMENLDAMSKGFLEEFNK